MADQATVENLRSEVEQLRAQLAEVVTMTDRLCEVAIAQLLQRAVQVEGTMDSMSLLQASAVAATRSEHRSLLISYFS